LIHGKDVAKEATVTRYSKDEYSEKAAVEAVTKKIFGEDEKKEELFNGKVVCLMDLTYIPKYTKGRVYEFVNGNCKDDYGNVINFGDKTREIPVPYIALYGLCKREKEMEKGEQHGRG